MILDVCPYWTNPTTGGGPERVHHLCRSISRASEVTEVSFRPTLTMMRGGISPLERTCERIDEGYSELRIPHVPAMIAAQSCALFGLPQDLILSQTCSLFSPSEVRSLAENASALQVEHPWQFRYAERLNRKRKPLILSTHNCETRLASQERIAHTPGRRNWAVDQVSALESHSLESADHVIAVSNDDIEDFKEMLRVDVKDKVTVAPNGVDCKRTKPPTTQEREEARKAVGVSDDIMVVFLGTRHVPNIEATRRIEEMMPSLDGTKIKVFIIGSSGEGMKSRGNMIATGHVPDYRMYLKAADIALNPLTTGSGTSLKALEYLAAGVPVVTTPTGIRGLSATDAKHVVVADLDDFPSAMISLAEDQPLRRRLSSEGRMLAENEYDWDIIGRRLVNDMTSLGFV